MLPYIASLTGGTVGGMMVGDILNSVPVSANVPATTMSASPQVTGDGTPVSTSPMSARQHLWLSAAIVVLAMVILLCGSRALRDARIA